MNEFTMSVDVDTPYEQAVDRVRQLLTEAGFGVLTEIDIAGTLRAKLGVETEPRIILGACRPTLAHEALQADPRVATMLPCNVVVTASGEGARVEALDPAVMTEFSPALADVATQVREQLSVMMESLKTTAKDRRCN